MKIKEFLAKLDDYYPGEYTRTQEEEIARYLEITEECLLAPLWQALTRIPLYGKPRPLIEHLEAARPQAVAAWERYADLRKAERAQACLPDEPYLPREQTANKLTEIMDGLRAARHYGPKGGKL